jgi:NTF2 fold immunity protein
MMKRIALLLLVTALLSWSQDNLKQPSVPKDGVVPKDGFVPNAEVAVTVAEAVLVPVYGKKTVESERPFKATLRGNIWVVEGKVPCEGPPDAVCPGGAGEVWISKRTGQILFMTHLQ